MLLPLYILKSESNPYAGDHDRDLNNACKVGLTCGFDMIRIINKRTFSFFSMTECIPMACPSVISSKLNRKNKTNKRKWKKVESKEIP